MSENYGVVSPPSWSEVWIIGGGKSAKNFFLGSLRGKRVVVINDVAEKALRSGIVDTATLFSLDNNWVRKSLGLIEQWPGEKYLALPLETWPDCDDISGVTYLRWSHADGLSDDPSTLCCGCNSGYAAINLAYLKKAKKIHLLGYDLDPRFNEQYVFWAPLFRNMLPQLRKSGVEVLNHNPDSYIDAFPKVGIGASA